MGLGAVSNSNATYLSIAGGFIWDRKKGSDDPNYGEQSFQRADKTEGIRKGAQYANLTGTVVGVQFRTHDEFGESINVTIEDNDGDRYIVSISTNNKNSQDMMKALLVADLSKPIFMKPYDFIGEDKKRAQGISFRQDGEKLSLKYDVPSKFQKESDFWKTASKKEVKRFFEDLSEWYVAEVEEKICSQFATLAPQTSPTPQESGLGKASSNTSKLADEVDEEEKKIVKKEVELPSQLQMKKALRAYIAENYDGETLPSSLSKEEVEKWYLLSLEEEELPFPEEGLDSVPEDELKEELSSLLGK